MYLLRQAARAERESWLMSAPSMISLPDVGRSMPAMRLRRVVLPLPEGPMRARNEPDSIWRSRSWRGRMMFSPRRYSRVSLWHSMSAMVGASGGLKVGESCVGEMKAAAFAEAGGGIDDELVAGVQAGNDFDPVAHAI